MSFLHPWALAMGAVALGLPILVHWLTRPRPRRLSLSTLRFVREAVHQRRALHRLRDWIILSLRVLAVALLAWAFSRPLLGDRRAMDTAESGRTSRVVLLDVSQSMAAAARGIEVFERARSTAAEHLVARNGLAADLVFAGGQPRRVFDGLSTNFADMRRELAQARPRPERCDVAKALLAAADVLGHAPSGRDQRRELVVITDLQQANWKSADFSVLPEDTVIRLESVADPQPPANLAILRAGAGGRAEFGRPCRLEVEVGNGSETPRNITVDGLVGESSFRLEGVAPPNRSVVLGKEITLQNAGWVSGEVKLAGLEDAVAADNSRSFVVEVRPRPVYGLITREQADRRPSASYYLERALAPQDRRESRSVETVTRVPSAQVNRELLAGVDLLVVDHPGKLPADAINLLAALLVRGKPLIYVTAEVTDASNLKLLAEAAGADLRLPVEFAPPANRQGRRGLALAGVRRDLPPFSIFGEQITTAFEPLRFTRGLDSRAVPGGLKDDILASYSDGTAGVVWTNCGAGALVVLNADLAESNIARTPVFVPLMGELTGNLLSRGKSGHVLACGEPVTLPLPQDAGLAASLKIRGPSPEASELGDLVDEPSGVNWRWPAAGGPGTYEVVRDGRTVLAVSTGIPPEESDLRPLAPSSLKDRLAGGRTIHYRAATGESREQDDLWTWIGVGCVGLMLLELFVLRVFKT
jgi:hypothetical protein